MRLIVALLFAAALALPVAAQDTDPNAKAEVSALKADYLRAFKGKAYMRETDPVRVIRRTDLPEGENALALTAFHFIYDENSFNYSYIRNIVEKFAAERTAALGQEKIKYLGVANNEGRGVWLDLTQPGTVAKFRPSEAPATATAPQPQTAPAATEATPSYSSGSSGTIYTGPRGGRYRITSSGKKSYIKRK